LKWQGSSGEMDGNGRDGEMTNLIVACAVVVLAY